MHGLPQYLYLAELFAGKRVLELGCGEGHGSWFLANHGAAHVIGVDRSQRHIDQARGRYRVANLDFRCEPPARIELEDDSIDCVVLPDGARFLRRGEVLDEIRRILVPHGDLIVSAASADRAARGGRGLSYYELFERLEPLFAPVRMVAQQPFVAAALVGYGNEDDALGVDIDTSLVAERGDQEVTHYLALCGSPRDRRPRGLTVVQLPTAEGIETIGASFGFRFGDRHPADRPDVDDAESPSSLVADAPAADGARAADPGAELEEHRATIAELRRELDRERAATTAATEELREREARVVELEAEREGWRQRTAIAEAGLGDSGEAELGDSGEAEADPATRALEEALVAARRDLARATENWQLAEAKNDDVWRRVGELQTDLERHREDAVANSARQRRAAQVALTRAMDEASKKLVSAQDHLIRAERRCEQLAAQLTSADSRAQELAGNLEEAEVARTRLEDDLSAADGRREEVERLLDELERDVGEEPASSPPDRDRDAAARALAELERELVAEAGLAAPPRAVAAGRDLVTSIAGQLSDCRVLLDELGRGLVELHEAPREATGRPGDSRLRDLAGELGVKDAELTLLNLGLSSVQHRVQEIVDRVRASRRAMAGQTTTEMLAIMDRLAESLAGYG